MFIQARRKIEVVRWVQGEPDAHGNISEGYAEPADARVYGWEVPRTAEPLVTGHDRVTVDMQMFVPPGFEIESRDRVNIGTKTYEVVGEIESASNGPFNFNPGATVQLRRVDG